MNKGIFGRRAAFGDELYPQAPPPAFGRKDSRLEAVEAYGDPSRPGGKVRELLLRMGALTDEAGEMPARQSAAGKFAIGEHGSVAYRGEDELVFEVHLPGVGRVAATGADVDGMVECVVYFALVRHIDPLSVCAFSAVQRQVGRSWQAVERSLIRETLVACHGDIVKAVDMLGLSIAELEMRIEAFHAPAEV
jgi:hypothetical protein